MESGVKYPHLLQGPILRCSRRNDIHRFRRIALRQSENVLTRQKGKLFQSKLSGRNGKVYSSKAFKSKVNKGLGLSRSILPYPTRGCENGTDQENYLLPFINNTK